jgi:hypothetical protein
MLLPLLLLRRDHPLLLGIYITVRPLAAKPRLGFHIEQSS